MLILIVIADAGRTTVCFTLSPLKSASGSSGSLEVPSLLFATYTSHLFKSYNCITKYWLRTCKGSLYSSAAIWDDCKQLEVQQQTPKTGFCFTRSCTRGCAWQRSGESIVLLLTIRANRCRHRLSNIFLYEQLDLLLRRCNQKSYKTIEKMRHFLLRASFDTWFRMD